MIFLVTSRKMIFIFPENMILFFRQKMKDHISEKNKWKYYSLKKLPATHLPPRATEYIKRSR